MYTRWLLAGFILPTLLFVRGKAEADVELLSNYDEYSVQEPRIFLPIIARNVEHSLPNWLGYLEKLDYPKHRIFIWIRSDHNEDNTAVVLETWANKARNLYHDVDIDTTNIASFYDDSDGPNYWTLARFHRMIELRQQALDEAGRTWADYIFFLDCDIFLTNPLTLWLLIEQKKTIIAPMLTSFTTKSAFSNYWCGRDESGYYKRTEEYLPILRREKKGCFHVPMIHSAVLIDLRRVVATKFYYNTTGTSYTGPLDDLMSFAHSVLEAGSQFHVLNKEEYGFLIEPVKDSWSLRNSRMKFEYIKLEWIADQKYMEESEFVAPYLPVPHKAGFDEVFVINLVRRPDRRKKMKESLKILGIDGVFIEAFDGKKVSDEEIENIGVKVLPKYADPYHGRPVTKGEIGCFMSHFLLWEKMVRENLNQVLFLEDDIRFEADFMRKLREVMEESRNVDWDFMYLGRKLVNDKASDTPIDGVHLLVKPGYSWWTLGYVITLEGAKKLLAPKPLQRFLPVDEYIPLMFGEHPNTTWSDQFEVKNLNAVSAEPFLLYPTHYIGDEGYFSDTETTSFVPTSVSQTSSSSTKVEL